MLQAIGFALPDIGYCQGMNFIASTLITVMNDEEKAFWVFVQMLIKRDMKTLFLPVRISDIKVFLGSARTASEELSNGSAD